MIMVRRHDMDIFKIVINNAGEENEVHYEIFFDEQKAIECAQKIEEELEGSIGHPNFVMCHVYQETPDKETGAFRTIKNIKFKHYEV